MDLASLDLNEDLFKWHADKIDRLHELDSIVRDCDERMTEIRIAASRLDLHPIEMGRVDGVGSMDELMYQKTQVLSEIQRLRDRLPVLLNTD